MAYANYAIDDVKPPYSYAQLITMAMKAHNGEKIVLGDIYQWIRDRFAFYRNGDNSWQVENALGILFRYNVCVVALEQKIGRVFSQI